MDSVGPPAAWNDEDIEVRHPSNRQHRGGLADGRCFVNRYDVRTSTSPRPTFADGATAGVGSLPHLDPAAAAAFAIGEFDIATVPTLPRRSSEELMLGQALVDIAGVRFDPDGNIDVSRDVVASHVHDAPPTDLGSEAFAGLRAFLDLAVKVRLDGAAVKWQFVGPVTLGVALHRAGLDRAVAFDLALSTVRRRLLDISAAVTAVLPSSAQMVVLDEPWFSELMFDGFPIPPDEAIDRLSSAMAALPAGTVTGVHCCAPFDVATLLASGPNVVSLPVAPELVDWVGYLSRFLDDGGIIAWGVVPTNGPLPSTSERHWRALSDLWCSLVQLGCDPVRLRRQSIVTPQCGLVNHSASVARRIARLSAEVGKRVQDQSSATRFALGA